MKNWTDCTSTDPRYWSGSSDLGHVRYALRQARAYREAGMWHEARMYLDLASKLRRQYER